MFENVRIKERLTKAFVMVAAITAIGAVVGLAACDVEPLFQRTCELRFFTGRYRQGDDHICQHEISDQRNHRI